MAFATLLVAVAIPIAAELKWRLTDEGALQNGGAGARVTATFVCSKSPGEITAMVRIGTRTFGVSSSFGHDDATRFARELLDADVSPVVWGDLHRSGDKPKHGMLDASVPIANFAELWPRFLAGCSGRKG